MEGGVSLFEALLIFTQSFEELSNLSSILPYYDVDPDVVQFVGTGVWDDPIFFSEPSDD